MRRLISAGFLAAACATAARAQEPLPLVPWPASIVRDSGAFGITAETPLVVTGIPEALAHHAADLIEAETGWHPPMLREGLAERAITLTLDASVRHREGYRLEVTATGIRLAASREAGIFYGLETLRQLLAMAPDSVPGLTIEDAPRFAWRGAHLDVVRHFFPVAFVKRYIDFLARYKLNTFHWHLTDDQGWRIEIRRYPRLTQVGAWRKETIVGKNFDPYIGDSTPHGGFYTQDEVREVVAYAAERHITVVPEIEMPGHAKAAIAAYPELACTPGPFEVWTRWGVADDILCPHPATFTFLENVLTEVMELFPGPWIHVGGDEVPKTRWKASAVAQEIIRREGLADESELQSWFIRRIERFLSSHGRRLIGWDEILEGGIAPGAAVMSWRGTAGGIEAARQGHDVVMSPGSHLYFDHAQGPEQLEPLSIGGNTPLDRVYGFEPVPAELSSAEAAHILGAQANMWTEYLARPEQVEFMLFPRLLALAEVVWSPASARDWESFIRRLPAQLALLDRLGVNYRVPHVEGLELDRLTLSDTAVIELRSLIPTGTIHYTLDGTAPTPASPVHDAPLRLPVPDSGVVVTAAVFLPDGRSSPARTARFSRTTLRSAERIAPGRVRPGLAVTYHPATFPNARAVAGRRPAFRAVADSVARTGRERAETYGLRFSGLLRVPADGLYEFSLVSDDGSVLSIGGAVVVDNDGWHSETERFGMAALAAGLHRLEVTFVQGSGGASLRASVRRPGGAWEPLAGAWLAHLTAR